MAPFDLGLKLRPSAKSAASRITRNTRRIEVRTPFSVHSRA
jgi:hypothetical protein